MSKLVASYPVVSQFDGVHSAYRCGAFQVALQKAAAAPGQTPAMNAAEVATLAHDIYVENDGPDTRANHDGMTLADLQKFLSQEGITTAKVDSISSRLAAGLAVVVLVNEASVYDLDVDGHVPYSWTPAGLHIISIYGETVDAWLCADTANIGERSIRPWPRRYEKSQLQVNGSVAIDFEWLHPKSYVVKPGDNLFTIAAAHNTTVGQIYNLNRQTIEDEAHTHGHPSSDTGNLIFPETVLVLP